MTNNKRYIDIYNKYYALVYGLLYAKTNDQFATEDLCQEIFIILMQKLDSIENIRKWLYGTIRNVLLQHFRKKNPAQHDIDDVLYDKGLAFVNAMQDTRIILDQCMKEINFNSEADELIYDMVARQNVSLNKTAQYLNLTKKKVRYSYDKTIKLLLANLNKKGIKNIEALL